MQNLDSERGVALSTQELFAEGGDCSVAGVPNVVCVVSSVPNAAMRNEVSDSSSELAETQSIGQRRGDQQSGSETEDMSDVTDTDNDESLSHDKDSCCDGGYDPDLALPEYKEEAKGLLDDSDALCCTDLHSEFDLAGTRPMECCNCRRSGDGVDLEGSVPESEMHAYMVLHSIVIQEYSHRGAFNFMDADVVNQNGAFVCWQCFCVLQNKTPNGNHVELYGWPAFIRRILDTAHGMGRVDLVERVWEILPTNYRKWWYSYLIQLDSEEYGGFVISFPANGFTDVSQVNYRLEDELKHYRTKTLFKFFDKYLSRPQVLCPYGCSEFLNRCNKLSFMKLLLFILGLYGESQLALMVGNKSGAEFLQGVRNDFWKLGHDILDIPGWRCLPRICFDVKLGPQILACRFHHKKSTGRYLHVPRPVGGCVLACDSDNRFASVVAKPRTSGFARANRCRRGQFTHSYQTAVANGRYEGFDTLVLGDIGQFDKSSYLSFFRDAVAVYCRPDVSAHVDMLVEHGHISSCIRDDVHRYIERELSEKIKYELTNDRGGTYVSSADAMFVQKQMNRDKEDSVMEDGRLVWYRAPWPMLIPFVHNDDDFGCSFPRLPYYKGGGPDFRILWTMAAIVTSEQSIWTGLAESVTNVEDWRGWGLLYLLNKCYPEIKPSRRRGPFKILNDSEMLTKIRTTVARITGNRSVSFGSDMIGSLMTDVPHVLVLPSTSVIVYSMQGQLEQETVGYKTIVVTNDHGSADVDILEMLKEISWFELIATVGVKQTGRNNKRSFEGLVQSRHGGHIGPKWWLRKHKYYISERDAVRSSVEDGAIHDDFGAFMGGWDVLVYRRTDIRSEVDQRIEYLECCKFPTDIRCYCHKMPLIVARIARQNKKVDNNNDDDDHHGNRGRGITPIPCMICGRDARYCCVQPSCSVAVCKTHYQETKVALAASAHSHFHLYREPDGTQVEDAKSVNRWIHEVQSDIEQLNQDIMLEENDSDSGSSIESVLSYEDDENVGGENYHSTGYDSENREDGSENSETTASAEIHRGLETDGSLVQDDAMWIFDNNVAADMEYVNGEESDEENESPLIATAGFRDIDFRSEKQYVGCHALLNKHSTLLLRRKGILRKNLQQQHFIAKIVARISRSFINKSGIFSSGTVPLLYPEGSLFPNIYYKTRGDGSIVGALPAPFLTDNTTLNKMGIASIHDHMRTRITSTFLLTSSDNTHLLYALDCCLNLGSRGHDTRVLLKRGYDPDLTKGDGIRMKDELDRSDEVVYTTEQHDNHVMCDKISYAMMRTLPTFFYTYTLNSETCYGMRVLKAVLDSDEVVRHIGQKQYENGMVALPVDRWSSIDLEFLKESVLESSGVLAMRMYENFWHVFRKYLMHSPDQPFGGTVLHLTDRTELQGDKNAGNLPHHHMAVTLAEFSGTPEQRKKIYEQIRGSVRTIVQENEVEELVEKGFLESAESLADILEDLARYLVHRCTTRCLRKRDSAYSSGYDGDVPKSADGDTAVESLLRQGYVCKVPNNHLLSPAPNAHCFRKIERPHCPAARRILRELDLLKDVVDPSTGYCREVLDDRLYAVHHIPPTTAEYGVTSPVLARLVLLMPSNQNVQLLDSVLAARYLTKYMIMLDESNRLYVAPPSRPSHEPTMNVGVDVTPNTKVTSIRRSEEEKKKGSRKNCVARIVGSPETTMLLLNFEQVYTSYEFEKVVTVPLEERPGVDNVRFYQRRFLDGNPRDVQDVDTSRIVLSNKVRMDWTCGNQVTTPIRPFDDNALMFAGDQCFSTMSMDKVTQFGLRPPELYWVRHQKLYAECFKVDQVVLPRKPAGVSLFDHAYDCCQNILHRNYEKCGWVDASFARVRVRAGGLERLVQYIGELKDEDFAHVKMPDPRSVVSSLFRRLLRFYQKYKEDTLRSSDQITWSFFVKKFLCLLDRDERPVAYYRRVAPKLGYRFLYSLLLGMGKFTTEMDFASCPTYLDAFQKADLIDANDVRGSIKILLRTYMMEHMFTQGGGTPRFDEDLETAYRVLESVLIHNQMTALETPPVLITRLREEVSERVQSYIRKHTGRLMAFVLEEVGRIGIGSSMTYPTLERLQNKSSESPSAQSAIWSVESICQSPAQTNESFQEQSKSLKVIAEQLHELVHLNHIRHAKCVCVVGGPGCGKTTIMMMGMLHAMSMSLRCFTTSLMSNRASQLAGIHWHLLFCLPTEVECTKTAGALAEKALANLYSYGHQQMAFIKYLDVLFVDELGTLAAKYLAAADIVCRRVRGCSQFMGGLLLICTYDHLQLPPINELPPLLSPHMMTSFRFCELTVSVRAAAEDLALREIQQLTRTPLDDFDDVKKRRFVELVCESCTFVDDFNDPRIPDNALFVFGKRRPGRTMRDRKLESYTVNGDILRRVAVDRQRTARGDWSQASAHVMQQLDAATKEDQALFFLPGMVYQITRNKKGKYHNHQMCMLWDLPTQEQLDSFSPIRMMVAPVGCTDIPAYQTLQSKQELVDQGWAEITIETATETTIPCRGGMKGKRKQYAMRLHVYHTLHVSMGCTLPGLCSKVSKDPSSPYYLWERAQVIVLLSRTKYAKDMYFVGDPLENAEAMLGVLLKEGQYYRHMNHLLDVMLGRDDRNRPGRPVPPVLTLTHHPFRPIDVPLPADRTGFCYLLVSLREPDAWYIGETVRLGERLNQHNTGIGGAIQTKSLHLRPWALLCFVTGFQGDKNRRKEFESTWQVDSKNSRNWTGRNPSPQDVVDIGVRLIDRYNASSTSCDLRMVLAGGMEPTVDTADDGEMSSRSETPFVGLETDLFTDDSASLGDDNQYDNEADSLEEEWGRRNGYDSSDGWLDPDSGIGDVY